MPVNASRANPSTGIGWLLFTAVAAAAWLLPGHAAPWVTFDGEWLMAAAVAGAAAWLAFRARTLRVDVFAAVLLLLAVTPPLQALAGRFPLPAEAGQPSLYLVGVGLAALVAREAEALAPGKLVDALWAAVVLGALLSAGMALYQWAALNWAGVLIEQLHPSGRAGANLSQPNLLATLLVWGLLGLWASWLGGRIGAVGAVCAAAFLLLGVVVTQSRTGFLEVAALAVAAVVWRRPLGTTRRPVVWAALGAWFGLLVLAWPALAGLFQGEVAASATAQIAPGRRPAIWRMMLDASLQSPWLGYGWNQGLQAQQQVVARYPDLHLVVQHAHNVVLDLAVWAGWPAAVVLAGAFGAWLWRHVRRAAGPAELLPLLALGVFTLHALLELPHVLFHFLGPVALWAGTLNARQPLLRAVVVPAAPVRLIVAALSLLLVAMFADYRAIEADLMAWRIRQARIGDLTEPPKPRILVLHSLNDALQTLRLVPRAGMPAAELDTLRRVAQRYPSDGALLLLARAEQLNGQPARAAAVLQRLCLLYPEAICTRTRDQWHRLQDSGFLESAPARTPAP